MIYRGRAVRGVFRRGAKIAVLALTLTLTQQAAGFAEDEFLVTPLPEVKPPSEAAKVEGAPRRHEDLLLEIWPLWLQVDTYRLKNPPPGIHSFTEISFQPVLPVPLGKNWKLINRPSIPFLNTGVPKADGGVRHKFGMGNASWFSALSPRPVRGIWGEVEWGLGFASSFPTNWGNFLGSKKTALGPAGMLFWNPTLHTRIFLFPQWTLDIAGPRKEPPTNFLNFQWGFAYTLKNGWAITTFPNVFGDFTQPARNAWTVPLGGGIRKIVFLGQTPWLLACQFYYAVVTPHDIPGIKWDLRFVISPLIPNPLKNKD